MVGGVTTTSPNRRRSARKYNIALDKWQSLYDNSLVYDADVRTVLNLKVMKTFMRLLIRTVLLVSYLLAILGEED